MHPYGHIVKLFVRERTQVNPVELAAALPGRRLHLKSIVTGLRYLRSDFQYVIHAVLYYGSGDYQAYDDDTVSRKLTSSTVLLEGLLDGLIICSLDEGSSPTPGMSFKRTAFDNQELQSIQEQVKDLKSYSESSASTYADFWTIADFWKHYLPCLPRPTEFERLGVYDFQVHLGSNLSGPLLHDLVVPTFNHACSIVKILGRQLGTPDGECTVESIV